MMNITQFFDFVNKVSSVLQLPGELIGILAVPSAILAYLTGRRRSLFEDSATATNEALIAEIRQGFAAMAATIAALSAGQTAVQSGDAPPAATGQTVRPAYVLPDFDLTFTQPTRTVTPRPRVRYLGLTICSALALLMTLSFVAGYIIYAQYANQSQAALYADPTYGFFSGVGFLGLIVTFIALVWACVRALGSQHYRWAIGLFLGTLALTVFTLFTMPGLLILIFAIRGPGRPAVTAPAARPATPEPELAGVTAGHAAESQQPFSHDS